MKISEFGIWVFVTIEASDWQHYGKSLLEAIKAIPGRMYYPHDKSWKILKSDIHLLSSFLPPFTLAEEHQAELDLQTFLAQFDEDCNAYSL